MTSLVANRPQLTRAAVAAGVGALSVAVGALVAVEPAMGLAFVGLLALVGLAFLAPVTHLTLLLLIAVLIPYGVQNSFSASGAGLLLSDALLLTALFRAAVVLLLEPIERRRLLTLALLSAFLVIVFLQAVHGFQLGRSGSQVGYELRVLLGFATFAIAMPIVATRDGLRRLAIGMMIIGLLLGLWGMAQWFLGIEEIGESGVGVREGISFTSSGRGQLQGGLYAFPVAVVLSFAVLVAGIVRGYWMRILLVTVLGANFLAVIFTYERTFWVATLLGMVFVVLKSDPRQRARAAVWGTVTAFVVLGALATLAPEDFTAARERLVSLSQYSNDDSVRSRVVETRHVTRAIESSPWTGSGLGATIFWGRAWQDVPPKANWYAHNGYLWVIWKVGLAGAILLFLLLAWAVLSRPPPTRDSLTTALRTGAQAALLVLLVSSITFPSFNSLDITGVMGTLVAICFTPALNGRGSTRTP
jgi:O-antigen ligase